MYNLKYIKFNLIYISLNYYEILITYTIVTCCFPIQLQVFKKIFNQLIIRFKIIAF